MPEYAVTFIWEVPVPDRLQAWKQAEQLAFALHREKDVPLTIAKVSEVETKQPETAKGR